MTMVTDDLRLELERQRRRLLVMEGHVKATAELLASQQVDALRCRTKIAEFEAAIILLERPKLDIVKNTRL